MIVYRLCKEIHAHNLTGKGAELVGGRWNSKGVSMIYTSQSRALCTAEIAVHTPLGIIPSNYMLISIELPTNEIIKKLVLKNIPPDWNSFPHPHSTQEIGNTFIKENKHLVLEVPSVIVQGEYNYLLNPSHKAFSKVKIKDLESFNFDKRLFIK